MPGSKPKPAIQKEAPIKAAIPAKPKIAQKAEPKREV